MNKLSLEKIADKVNEKYGLTGRELENFVHGVAFCLASITDNKQAQDYFEKRYNETA